jgi:phosphoesterase RecJ-like protein
VPILNVDHHISNTQFGQVTLIDPTCASATQVLYQWFMTEESMRKQLNADIATLLLTGLITDTRSFQNPNTTPKSLEVAAELLERGARQQEIIKHIYKTKPLSTLKIWGRALNKIQYDAPSRFVWSTISLDDLKEMNASSKETTGILDELISTIPNADVYILFTELEGGGFKASVRSSPAVDVNRLTGRTFGGGGHARAAGFSIKEPGNFQLQVLEAVQKLKEGVKDDQISENRAQPTPMTVPKPVVPMVTEDIPSVSKKETKDIDIVDLLEEKDGTTEKEGKKNGQAKKK